MIVSFTGTREGMTSDQELMVNNLLEELHPHTVRHGMCIGADWEFHQCALLIPKAHRPKIYGYPGVDKHGESPTRAAFDPATFAHIAPPAPYLKRDRHMAVTCDALIATPKEDHMVIRSGTWATVRYAMKAKAQGKHLSLYIILPDGEVWDGEEF